MSRTIAFTVFKYFPNQRAMLVAAHPETDAASFVPPDVGDDPEDRLLAAVSAFIQMIIDTGPQQRTVG